MSDDNHEEELLGGGGGGTRYAVVGLLLFGLAIGLYFLTKPSAPEQAAAPTAPVAPAPTPPPAYADDLAIAEEEPDASVAAEPTRRATGGGGGGGGDWSCSGEIAMAGNGDLHLLIVDDQGEITPIPESLVTRGDSVVRFSLPVQLTAEAAGKAQLIVAVTVPMPARGS